jgi:hypothetical protein
MAILIVPNHIYFVYVHTLPAAKIPPGADVDDLLEHGDGDSPVDACHGDDRDNVMMMKMMNSPHEPIPLADQWQHHQCFEHAASSVSDSSSSCGSSHSETSDDFLADNRPAIDHHFGEETDLGEFLMDTFDGVDVMAVMEDMASI